ncbi:MAG TPA: hypothetical protein VFQ05_18475 [Candidatus Eisenbacteria bacterium]|nr:hypothetical protein [Candidatus Eisenbacteria bacterium]
MAAKLTAITVGKGLPVAGSDSSVVVVVVDTSVVVVVVVVVAFGSSIVVDCVVPVGVVP